MEIYKQNQDAIAFDTLVLFRIYGNEFLGYLTIHSPLHARFSKLTGKINSMPHGTTGQEKLRIIYTIPPTYHETLKQELTRCENDFFVQIVCTTE